VPSQTSLSGGREGHKGIEAITFASSGKKMELISPKFHV
jgi:hypothetical protein